MARRVEYFSWDEDAVTRRSVIQAATAAAALLILLAPQALAQPALEGRWVLVKQTYGKGEANLGPGIEWHAKFTVDGCLCPYDELDNKPLPNNMYLPREQIEHQSRICLRCEYRWAEACWQDPEPPLPSE